MRNDIHNPTALAILGYAGVVYAAVAVFVVTLFGASAVDSHVGGYTFPADHWILAASATAVVVGIVLSAVRSMLYEVPAVRHRR
ncbi:hypothetical protein [Williamsia deligens]|uniref:Uncharacterized protein n=1 Tax=Williamsia deligens TaxID=321325 RepID=A0ABW3G6L2_9NOCA|nr:hypothetical protein [Williamsia deligens]MCP2193097.1 hypothetical protein [Williamsia deligens]